MVLYKADYQLSFWQYISLFGSSFLFKESPARKGHKVIWIAFIVGYPMNPVSRSIQIICKFYSSMNKRRHCKMLKMRRCDDMQQTGAVWQLTPSHGLSFFFVFSEKHGFYNWHSKNLSGLSMEIQTFSYRFVLGFWFNPWDDVDVPHGGALFCSTPGRAHPGLCCKLVLSQMERKCYTRMMKSLTRLLECLFRVYVG